MCVCVRVLSSYVTHSKEPVLLAQVHGLLPTVVHLVQVSSNAPKLHQLMPFQTLGQGDVVKVVERVDGLPQVFKVLLLNVDVIQSLVHCLVVMLLDCLEVRLHQAKVISLEEEADGACVVQSRHQHHKEVVNEAGAEVEVELQCPVVQLNVGHLGDYILECALLPGLRGVGHHGQHGIVVFLVLIIEEDQF